MHPPYLKIYPFLGIESHGSEFWEFNVGWKKWGSICLGTHGTNQNIAAAKSLSRA